MSAENPAVGDRRYNRDSDSFAASAAVGQILPTLAGLNILTSTSGF